MRKLNFLFKRSLNDLYFNQVTLFSFLVVYRYLKQNCTDHRLGRSSRWQPKRAGGRMGCSPGELPSWPRWGHSCARGACFLRVKNNVILWGWFSHSSVVVSCQFLNFISLEMFFKLASIIMTQNFVLNYDYFWGSGIISIYFNCLKFFLFIFLRLKMGQLICC